MSETVVIIVLLLPLAIIITYYDVRYRRIPNAFVLATLASGIAINSIFGGLAGLYGSLGGCALAFVLMFMLHLFGAMGAGDVKLFAAIGAVTGASLVLPTFLVVILTGGLLAVSLDRSSRRRHNYDAASFADIGRISTRLGDAEVRGPFRSQTHNSLRRGNHNRQHYFNSHFSRLNRARELTGQPDHTESQLCATNAFLSFWLVHFYSACSRHFR